MYTSASTAPAQDVLPTIASTLDALRTLCGCDAGVAKRLTMTRQEVYLARQRGRLSDRAIVAAAEVLDLPAPYLLAALHADHATDPTAKAAWITAANAFSPPAAPTQCQNYNCGQEKPKETAAMPTRKSRHIALTEEKEAALRVLKWCHCVPKIAPDSPRLAYYVSRWDVPGKIARALADGTFDDLTKDCPPIDLCHLPAGVAALDEHARYQASFDKAPQKSLPTPAKTRSHPYKSKLAVG